MTTRDRDVVSALRNRLADRLGHRRFDLWFGKTTEILLDDHGLAIVGPERMLVEWIRTNYHDQILSSLRDLIQAEVPIRYQVAPATVDQVDATRREDSGRLSASSRRASSVEFSAPSLLIDRQLNGPTLNGELPGKSVASGDPGFGVSIASRSTAAAAPVDAKAATCSEEQRTAPAGQRRFADLRTFAAGEVNRLALAAAQMVVAQRRQVSPLLIYGPPGTGKTHLLEGIWRAARSGVPRRTTIYLSAEQFTTQFLSALRQGGMPEFRQRYRGVDLLLIDDLHFFVGKRTTQSELLHTVDTLLRQGKQLVLAADRPPSELAELGPELNTRLQSGLVCRLETPDLPARRDIVRRWAAEMQIDVPESVVELIAVRVVSNARALKGALCRLQAVSEATGAPITEQHAAEALGDLFQEYSRPVKLDDIEKAVCETFGLSPQSLQGDARSRTVSHPRMLAMWLARKYTRAALSEIGQYFGRRSHSTVVAAQRRVDDWRSRGETLRLAHRCVSVDEALRQVERKLLSG